MSIQQFEAELLHIDSVIKLKHSQCDGHIEMAKLHILIRDTDEAQKEVALAKASMAEISALEEMAMTLNATKDSQKTA